MAARQLPDAETLRKLLDYDAETGRLFWRARPDGPEKWNARFSGREAGSLKADGYIKITIDKKKWQAHRVIWAMSYGVDPSEMEVDHINGDRTDNSLSNLRLVEKTAQQKNMKRRDDNSSGCVGVHYCSRAGKYRAKISGVWIGDYKSKDDAIAARKIAEQEHGFHANHGRDAAGASAD